MGFDDGQIILDSENGVYYAGQTVYGRMVFPQDKKKNIQGIYVDMKGFCKVHWTSSRSRREGDRTVHYTVNHDSHEEYFRSKHFLFGNENGDYTLKAGDHEFRFACPIPINCPSSFEGSYGHIRYRIKVVMLTTGIFSSNKDKWIAINVHAPMDLNQNPYCREPMEFDLSSNYCCWCVSSGSSQVLVKMPVSGYCPGQVIPMEVTCQNDSTVEIDEIKFAIKKDMKFTAAYEPDTRYDHDTVAEIKKGPIPGRTTRNWTVEMEVPAMDIYNVDACQYIDIDYSFKVSTEVGGCHDGTEETYPIIFGTVPLVGFQDNVVNPLHDQLPQSMEFQNAPAVNGYPAPPIINQPLPNSPYPNGNVYPNNSPYPGGNPGFPTTPNLGGRTSPYPPGNQPYPNVSPYPPNQPYPGPNPSYPGANPPYPGVNPPFPDANPPFPGANPPFPGANPPFPGANPPFPGANHPYPGATPPYPGANPYPAGNSPNPAGNSPYPPGNSPYPPGNSPYPPPYSKDDARQSPVPPRNPNVTSTTPLKTGTLGFGVTEGDPTKVPLLPTGANVPYPSSPPSNPYATASAPEPSTPGNDEQKLPLNDTADNNSSAPPYNPDFIKNSNKKDEKETQ